jgi:hypothetical protein
MTYFARALGATHISHLGVARRSIDSLNVIRDRLTAKGETYWAEQVAIQQLIAQAWLDLSEQRTEEAVIRMRRAAAREHATEKSATTPGPLVPARESLADLFLALGRPAEALDEYDLALASDPNRYHSLEGAMQAAKAAGEKKTEAKYRAKLNALTAK